MFFSSRSGINERLRGFPVFPYRLCGFPQQFAEFINIQVLGQHTRAYKETATDKLALGAFVIIGAVGSR